MEERTSERISTSIHVKFFSGKSEYSGTITNLSERGMFISTKVSFPLSPQLKILIPLKEEILKVLGKIRSFGKSGGMYDGIGIELLNPPQNYLKFVNSLRTAVLVLKHPPIQWFIKTFNK